MVRNVFRLDDRQIGSLMVPRGDVVSLDVDDCRARRTCKRIEETDHSRFPVVRGGLRDIVGVVTARELLTQALRGAGARLGDRPAAAGVRARNA